MKEQWKRLDSDAKLLINVEEGKTVPVKIEIPTSGYNNANQIDCYKRLLILLRIFVLISIIFLSCSAITWYAKNYQQITFETNNDNSHHPHHHHTVQPNAEASQISFGDKFYDVSKEQENDNNNLNNIQITPVSDYKISKEDIPTERTVDINTNSEHSSESDGIESDSVIVETPTETAVNHIENEESENYSLESDEKELWTKLDDFLNVLKYAHNPFLLKQMSTGMAVPNGVDETDSETKKNILKKKFIELIASSSEESDENNKILELKNSNSETDEESTNIDDEILESLAVELINAIIIDSHAIDLANSNSEEIIENAAVDKDPTYVTEEEKVISTEGNIEGLENVSKNLENGSEERSKASEEQKEEISEISASNQSEEITEKNLDFKEFVSEEHDESKNNESTSSEQIDDHSEEKSIHGNVESEEKNENQYKEFNESIDESTVNQGNESQEEKDNNTELPLDLTEEKELVSEENESLLKEQIESDETEGLKKLNNIKEHKYIDVSAKLSHFIQDPLDLLVWYYQNKNDPDFIDNNDNLKVYTAKLLFSSNIQEFDDDLNTVLSEIKDKSYEEKEDLSSLNLYYILNRLLFKVSLMNQHSLSTDKIRAALEYSNALDLKAADKVQQQQQTLFQMMRNVGNFEDLDRDNDKLKSENVDQLESTLDSQETKEQNSESILTDNMGDSNEKNSNFELSENNDHKNYHTETTNPAVIDNFTKEKPTRKEKVENDKVYREHQLYEQYEDYYDY